MSTPLTPAQRLNKRARFVGTPEFYVQKLHDRISMQAELTADQGGFYIEGGIQDLADGGGLATDVLERVLERLRNEGFVAKLEYGRFVVSWKEAVVSES